MPANIINHIVFVLDSSSSMTRVANEVIKVTDNQIRYLADRSKELDQETRVTVYRFGSSIECLVYDKDVLRMPSIAKLYYPSGMTRLIDASVLAIDDLSMTPEKYGEHSFLVYVLTDGMENQSTKRPTELLNKITALPDHWTVAAFVPNQVGVHEAKRFGFPAQNIAIWDATTAAGVSEAGEKIRQTTENFMSGRVQGIRGTRNLFSLEKPSLAKVSKSLEALTNYQLLIAAHDSRIDDFVTSHTGRRYQRGMAYYELIKREEIQPQKAVAVLDTKTMQVYAGDGARGMLGLPNEHVKVAPGDHDYAIFIQSTSDNRKVLRGQRVLVV